MYLLTTIKLTDKRARSSFSIAALVILFLAAGMSEGHCAIKPIAPNFRLVDTRGRSHALSDFRGKPTALMFLCGCPWCQALATALSKADDINQLAGNQAAWIIVVFSGTGAEADEFAKQTGLAGKPIMFLVDPDSFIAAVKYNAEPCPRIYALSSDQHIIYTNNHKDDRARTVSADFLLSKLRAAIDSQIPVPIAHTVLSAPGKNSSAPPVLSPIIGNGTQAAQQEGLTAENYDFGSLDRAKSPFIEHDFFYANKTSQPIVLDRLQPTCSCTDAELSPPAELPFTVAPGATIDIKTRVNFGGLLPGAIEKSVYIFGTDTYSALGLVTITGSITDSVQPAGE